MNNGSMQPSSYVPGRKTNGGVLAVQIVLEHGKRRHRAELLADTGAATSSISPLIARILGIDIANPVRYAHVITAQGTMQVPVIKVDKMLMGGKPFEEIELQLFALPREMRLDGLLGVNVFSLCKPMFEFEQSRILLFD